jgi:hypothetical protein
MPSYRSLSQLADGELAAYEFEKGRGAPCIKGTYKNTPLVVVLCATIDGAAGPYTLVDLESNRHAIALGKEWTVEFDPFAEVLYSGTPALGDLILTDPKPSVVTHNESGLHVLALDGGIGNVPSGVPRARAWRLMLRMAGSEEYREVWRHPAPVQRKAVTPSDGGFQARVQTTPTKG